MTEQKAAKSFIDAANHRLFNPYEFANIVKVSGDFPAAMLHRVSLGWFRLNEIDYRYGIGDPVVGEMAARIIHEVVEDYDEFPDYDPTRGFENRVRNTRGTWEGNKPSSPPSFIRRSAQ